MQNSIFIYQHRKLHGNKSVTIQNIFKCLLPTAFYQNMNSVLENRNSLILKFPEHYAGKMYEYCTLVKDDALTVWQSSSAEADWGYTHITVKKGNWHS